MQWLVADATYGNSPTLRQAVAESGRYYVMELGARHQLLLQGRRLSLKDLTTTIGPEDWLLFSRLGEQGPLTELWASKRVIMPNDDISEQWLLIRRALPDTDNLTFYLCNAPADTSLSDMVSVAWARHDIESLASQGLKEGKHQLGMADYEVRSWHGWHRHMTLSMLAHSFLAFRRAQQREKKALADVSLARAKDSVWPSCAVCSTSSSRCHS